jgi:hypothetical protein
VTIALVLSTGCWEPAIAEQSGRIDPGPPPQVDVDNVLFLPDSSWKVGLFQGDEIGANEIGFMAADGTFLRSGEGTSQG